VTARVITCDAVSDQPGRCCWRAAACGQSPDNACPSPSPWFYRWRSHGWTGWPWASDAAAWRAALSCPPPDTQPGPRGCRSGADQIHLTQSALELTGVAGLHSRNAATAALAALLARGAGAVAPAQGHPRALTASPPSPLCPGSRGPLPSWRTFPSAMGQGHGMGCGRAHPGATKALERCS